MLAHRCLGIFGSRGAFASDGRGQRQRGRVRIEAGATKGLNHEASSSPVMATRDHNSNPVGPNLPIANGASLLRMQPHHFVRGRSHGIPDYFLNGAARDLAISHERAGNGFNR